jgi:hypothetical protein
MGFRSTVLWSSDYVSYSICSQVLVALIFTLRRAPSRRPKPKIYLDNCGQQTLAKERELPAASQATRVEVSKAPPLIRDCRAGQ